VQQKLPAEPAWLQNSQEIQHRKQGKLRCPRGYDGCSALDRRNFMIRTSIQNGKQVIPKLALRSETIRALRDTELAAIVGGKPGCTALTNNLASGCPPAL
jgi:hypothetical protein